jgi:hypothetical protein
VKDDQSWVVLVDQPTNLQDIKWAQNTTFQKGIELSFSFYFIKLAHHGWFLSDEQFFFSNYNARHLKKSRSAQIVGEAEEWTTWRCGDRSQMQCPASLLWWSHKQNSSSCTSGDTNLAFGT